MKKIIVFAAWTLFIVFMILASIYTHPFPEVRAWVF